MQGVVLVLYSLLQQRTKLYQDCCFGGYCGLPVYVMCTNSCSVTFTCIHRPINFIHETKDRWVYCAAFGMLVNLFTVVVLGVGSGGESSVGGVLQSGLYNYMLYA